MLWFDEPSDEDIRNMMGMSKEEFYDDPLMDILTEDEEFEKEMRSLSYYDYTECETCGQSYQGHACPLIHKEK